MKKNLLILLAFYLFIPTAFSQTMIRETEMMHQGAERPALAVTISIPVDESRDLFVDYMKEEFDTRIKGNGFLAHKDILSAEKAVMPSVHDKTFDLYVMFEEISDAESRMNVMARNGYDLYFNDSYASESRQRIKELMVTFDKFATETYYQELLDSQTERLDDSNNAQAKAEKTIKQNEEEIADNLKDNEELRKKNEELRNEIQQEKEKLERIQEKIEKSQEQLNAQ